MIGAICLAVFLLGAALFGSMILLPLYYQVARGQTPLDSGLLIAPQGLGAMLTMPLAGVHIVEATKQVYRTIPAKREKRRLVPALEPVLAPSPGGAAARMAAPSGPAPQHRSSTRSPGRQWCTWQLSGA